MPLPSSARPAEAPPPLPKPRPTWRGVAVVALLWVLYAVLYTGPLARTGGLPFWLMFVYQLELDAVLALYSVPVWYLVVREMDDRRWTWRLAAHVVLGPLYAWAGLQTLLWMVGGPSAGGVAGNLYWIYVSLLTLYVVQFALYHTVRSVQRLRHRERQAAELMALAKDRELAALKAQINPHFLFNTLNAISAMVTRDPEETRQMIAQLADLLRYALDSDRKDLVPLEAELQFAEAYLGLEARRFPDRLRVRFEVDPAVRDALVPPMLLQPLVENAVRHGIGPSEAGGEVTVQARAEGPGLYVCVEDTGHGAGPGAARSSNGIGPNGIGPNGIGPNGIGLANTSARLERRFGPGAALHAGPLAPHGFRVWFHVPLRTAPAAPSPVAP